MKEQNITKLENAVRKNRVYFPVKQIEKRNSYWFWRNTLKSFVTQTNITSRKKLKEIFILVFECMDEFMPFGSYTMSLLYRESQLLVLKQFNEQGMGLFV